MLRSIARTRAALVLIPLLLFMGLLGCAKATAPGTPALPSNTDATLRAVVQAEGDVDAGVAGVLQITQQLYAAGTVDKATAGTITGVLAKVTAANGQAITITKGLVTIPAAQRSTIQSIIVPVINDLQDSLTNGLISIKDANAKAALSAALSGLLVTLQIIQSSTGGA
jgi:hypothetical protein